MDAIKPSSDQMGDVGERTRQKSGSRVVKEKIQRNAELVLPLENCASMNVFNIFVIEQEEPDESRGSRPVLWEHRGETPLCDPTG